MAKIKHAREDKRQLGQFFTPEVIASRILGSHQLKRESRVLEPGFGGGAFLIPLIEKFLALRGGDFEAVVTKNIWGIEIDRDVYERTISQIESRWGPLPINHNLHCGDFLNPNFLRSVANRDLLTVDKPFDLIIGNPPFGGTVSLEHQDALERLYGRRNGHKIKRETYALFIVKSIDLLRDGGVLQFICSDTFLTIPTMKGLRTALMEEGASSVVRLNEFSEETSYPMVVLQFEKGKRSDSVLVEHTPIPTAQIRKTANFSWRVSPRYSKFFDGALLGDVLIASSGMTTGKNEFFVREIVDGAVIEPYTFEFFEDAISLERELSRARLGKLPKKRVQEILKGEAEGATQRNVKVIPREEPTRIALPHPDYCYYNKAQAGRFYVPPRYAIYWKDDGDAVKTYKKNGSWYLRGVGGAPFFRREGLTWRLVSAALEMRYLPAGYILDSGAPCAFLRPGVDAEEIWFILGWCNTTVCSDILKTVINHTMNIQSKDVERLPYPWWVPDYEKRRAIRLVQQIVGTAMKGHQVSPKDLLSLSELYEFR